MFECALEQGDLFKRIIGAISDLVQDGNFQINSEHMSFQGMDSSHVSLVAMSLKQDGFIDYRCDRDITLGINFSSLSKVLKCMGLKDKLKLKCHDNADIIYLCFENQNSKRISNFELKLMDIDSEQLGIPNTDYSVNVSIPSQLFQKIIRDLSAIGDSVTIAVSKQGVKFEVNGDIGKGDVLLTGSVKKQNNKAQSNDDSDNKNDDTQDTQIKDENDTQKSSTQGNDNDNNETKGNDNNDDEDDDMKDKKDSEDGNDDDNDADIEAVDDDDDDETGDDINIIMEEDVTQTFALRYLLNFTKATNLSKKVILSMGAEVPLKCWYKIDGLGDIAYYLAPKIDDDE